MIRFPKIVLLLLLLLFPCPARPQDDAVLERVGIEQGMSQGFATCLMQDREGFIWVGTPNGLNRYDGHRFLYFSNDPFDRHSLPGNYVTYLLDLGDFVFVGTNLNGLSIFHKQSRRFFRLPFAGSKAEWPEVGAMLHGKLLFQSISRMFLDGEGSVWLLGETVSKGDLGACRMVFPERFLEKLARLARSDTAGEAALLAKLSFENWSKGHLEFGLLEEAKIPFQITPAGKVLALRGKKWVPQSAPPAPIAKFGLGEHDTTGQRPLPGDFWVCSDGAGGRVLWQSTDGGKTWAKVLEAAPGMHIFQVDGQFVWFKRGLSEVLAYPIRQGPFSVDTLPPTWAFRVRDDARVLSMLDRSGNLWLAESAYGLIRFNPRAQAFRHSFSGRSVMTNLSALPNGNIFHYRWPEGFVFAGPTGEQEAFLKKAFRFDTLERAAVHTDAAGRYWMLGIEAGGYACLVWADPVAKTSKRHVLPVELPSRPNNFAFDPADGSLWFPASRELVRFDLATERTEAFDFSILGLNYAQFYAITKTADGSWWLAAEAGLVRAKPLAGNQKGFQFQLLKIRPADHNSLNCNNIACLFTDQNDPFVLWLGTKGGGLNRLDVRTEKFSHLTVREGLPNGVVYGILPDGAGNLWLSTNRGLVRYHPATGALKSFRQADGLQNDEFNTWAFGKGNNGELLFGGVNGVNAFDPKALNDNPVRPRTVLTGLEVNNRPVTVGDSTGILETSIEFCRQITLPFSQNTLRLEFAALEFSAPAQNRYRFYLEGAEKPWAHEGENHFAEYLNLAPGRYTFQVHGSNNDGIWSDAPATLRIDILPPWYRTVWAYLAYALISLGLLRRYFRYKENQRRMALELERQQLAAEQTRLEMGKKTLESEKTEQALEKSRIEGEQTKLELAQKQLEAEQTLLTLEKTRHDAEGERRENELKLEEITQQLLEKSKTISEARSQMKKRQTGAAGEASSDSDEMERMFENSILTQQDWQQFRQRFDLVFPGFQRRLERRYPQMTPSEIRMLLLAKMGLTQPGEAAAILGISAVAVKKTWYRLRKKLGVEDMQIESLLSDI